jgi:acetyl-CoA C-acetyltransferase
MSASETVIVSACRTAVGTLNGALSTVPAQELGATVIREAIQRAGLAPEDVDEVILGHVLQGGAGQHPARRAALLAGLPLDVSAFAVNKVCGSGLFSVCLADQAIRAGSAAIVVAGGMENMSLAPYMLQRARTGYRMGHGELIDGMIKDGLWDVSNDIHMGSTAENVAEKYGITREEQDAFSAGSQAKCAAAMEQGFFAEEIVPVEIPQRKKDPIRFQRDEFPRANTTAESLGGLRPAFKKDGTVTAGNASGINDGAGAVVVMSRGEAERRGIQPLATIRAWATAGVDPAIMGVGPVPATRKALERAGLTLDHLDLMEFNEAFAAQSLGCKRELNWDDSKVNVNGGAIAIGHPIGASGTRILVSLLHEMKRRDVRYGLAALCIGGGEGVALIVERS